MAAPSGQSPGFDQLHAEIIFAGDWYLITDAYIRRLLRAGLTPRDYEHLALAAHARGTSVPALCRAALESAVP